MSRYLVTGCAGFIGARVTEALLGLGHTVVGIDSLGAGGDLPLRQWRLARLLPDPGFEFHDADIRSGAAVAGIVESVAPEALINLAARTGVRDSVTDARGHLQTNCMGVLELLESCRRGGVGRFIQASTSSVYGADTPAPFRESAPAAMPLSPYAASKKAAEELCHAYHHLHGLSVTVLRFFTVYGPAGRPDMSVFRFVRAVAEDQPLTLYGDGGERDFTHVDDIARGVILALDSAPGYGTINLGAGRPVRVGRLISMIEDMIGRRVPIRALPRPAADVDSTWADISRARRVLGWQPRVCLSEGLAGAIEWYRENRSWARDLA